MVIGFAMAYDCTIFAKSLTAWALQSILGRVVSIDI